MSVEQRGNTGECAPSATGCSKSRKKTLQDAPAPIALRHIDHRDLNATDRSALSPGKTANREPKMAGEYSALLVTASNLEQPAEAIKLVKKPIPTPGPGEVLVKITTRPINPSDIFSLQGVYPGFTDKLPAVPGLDGAGVVVSAGAGVGAFARGARVTALGWPAHEGNGSWQEYAVVPASSLVRVPDGVDDAAASQFFVNPVTVVGLLDAAAAPKGSYLLVSAAGSVLSRMLLSAAKVRGVKTIGIVRRADAVAEVKAAGADEVLVSTTDDVAARVRSITGGAGAHAAIDSVGGELSGALGDGVRDGGVVYVYGAMGGLTATASIPAMLFRGVSYTGFWLKPYLDGKDAAGVKAVVDEVWRGYAEGWLAPLSGKSFPLAEYAAAIAEATREARGGKVLLTS